MPGARPTISSAASGSPNDGTGALNQSGWRARIDWRNSSSLGQSWQLGSGAVAALAVTRRPLAGGTFSILEIFVIAPRRHRGGALQELRRVMTGFAGGRAFRRIASELGLQLHQIGEDIRLPAQLIGDHRRLARDRGDDGDADAAALHRFDQRAEIAVAG